MLRELQFIEATVMAGKFIGTKGTKSGSGSGFGIIELQ
jgi:hypothetical protein